MSAQKALGGSETETRELLGRTEENSVSPIYCPQRKSMSFHKKETEKIELVVRPGSQVVKGKVLMEFHRSTTFSASRDVHNLISLLEQNLGMSKSSMYNRSEFDQTKTWKQTRGVDFYAKRQFMRLPEEERNEKCAEYSRIHDNLESAGQRVTITNLQESGNDHLYSFFHCNESLPGVANRCS